MPSFDTCLQALKSPGVIEELQEGWKSLGADKRKNGVELMLELYKLHPETKQYFGRLGDLSPATAFQNRKLRGHGTTLMYGVECFMDQLDDFEVLEDVFRKLAVNHINRGVTSDKFKLIGTPLLNLLAAKMGGKCTDKTKDAWVKLLDVICVTLDEEAASR